MAFAGSVSGNWRYQVKFLELERLAGKYMNTNYSLGDYLIRVKNASMVGQKSVTVQNLKLIASVAAVLKKEGYLSEVFKKDDLLTSELAFISKAPVLTNLKLVSKPGLRIYISARSLSQRRSPSWLILSTSKGMLSSRAALKQNTGGEIIAEVW